MTGGESILSSTEFQMSLLMFVALAGYLIAYRINQSAVVGIILAGIIVGPSLLSLVTYTEFVSTLAHLGAVVLLFTIGLEFNIKDIAKIRYFVIALFGIIVPAIGGFFLAGLFDFDFEASVFIGTALTATSIAITANVLREMGKLQTETAKAIIGAAVIDDVLALLALSVSEGLVSGELSAASLLITGAKAIGFIAIGILIGKTVLGRFLVRLDRTRICGKYPESIFIFTIMVAFLYAMVAEFVGLSAIIGSFLAGASFAGIKLIRGDIFREGAEHLQIIFASIFFVSLGVIMDLHFMTLNILWFVLALSAVAIITKLIGCGLPAKIQHMSLKDSMIIGMGMVPRGEVAMIVALIGLSQNMISQSTYSALILMSLLTTIIPPLILRNWLFKR
ncbi:MAG: sodium:proton exchanger [Chloroflexi bacterium RBG_16_56_11]|nr:MAG: sodium:proton exchanger [Chloroflexi bacterium RBG_16_56_11]